jgi:hypothetical protein
MASMSFAIVRRPTAFFSKEFALLRVRCQLADEFAILGFRKYRFQRGSEVFHWSIVRLIFSPSGYQSAFRHVRPNHRSALTPVALNDAAVFIGLNPHSGRRPWRGDILHSYAIAALFLFPFRKLRPGQLLMLGLSFALATTVFGGIKYAE